MNSMAPNFPNFIVTTGNTRRFTFIDITFPTVGFIFSSGDLLGGSGTYRKIVISDNPDLGIAMTTGSAAMIFKYTIINTSSVTAAGSLAAQANPRGALIVKDTTVFFTVFSNATLNFHDIGTMTLIETSSTTGFSNIINPKQVRGSRVIIFPSTHGTNDVALISTDFLKNCHESCQDCGYLDANPGDCTSCSSTELVLF